MLNIITGAMRSEKSNFLMTKILESVNSEKKVCIIIPDQFSFEYDKKLYKALGAKKFNEIKVISFKRLSEEIIKKYGSSSGTYADDNTKLIMMFFAIKQLKSSKNARYYIKQLDKSNFAADTLNLVKELRQAGISPEDFEAAGLDIKGVLLDKFNDLSRLYSAYESFLKKHELKDSLTTVSEASGLALRNNYFKDFDVYLDEFNSFTFDELEMLESILSNADNLSISLTISKENNINTKLSPFSNVIKTKAKLLNLAKTHHHQIEIFEQNNFLQYKSNSIEYINKNIFYPLAKKTNVDANIEIISAIDIYEEVEFVATEIKRLVCDKGYKYSDIAIISRQLSDYYSVFDGTFERYEIPFFMDFTQPVTNKALVLYIMSIFEAVNTRTYNTEAILRYIKSTLSSITEGQVSAIEDYCYQWNVTGEMWLSDFTAEELITTEKQAKAVEQDPSKKTYLEKINIIRKAIIEPLEKFKQLSKDSTGKVICEGFYMLVDEINLSNRIFNIIKSAIDNSENEDEDTIIIAREFKQLWRILVSAMDSIYTNIATEKISMKDFYELLKLMLSQTSVATPPQKLDAVTVASAERSRLAEPKIVFVIGVNDGIMPLMIKDNGIFSDKDKEALDSAGLKLSKTTLWKIAEERLIAYISLSSPSDFLYISYSETDLTGKQRRPSTIINQLVNMFNNLKITKASEKGQLYYCTTGHAAYYKYIEAIKNKTPESTALKSVLEEIPEYNQKLSYLKSISETTSYSLSKNNSSDIFFNNGLNISATRVEKYNKCPFSYFCQYGLKLTNPKAVEINPISTGTIVHYCLEEIMSETSVNGEKSYNQSFTKLTNEEIDSKISFHLNKFKKEKLGGDFGKTKRFDAQFNKLKHLTLDVINNLQREFSQCAFTPSEFELSLSDADGRSVLEIEVEKGLTIRIYGSIDRVDTYEKDGNKFIRIIDYKTGVKKFLFEELYHGLNLQMLLYLLALTHEGETTKKYDKYEPAGILYMPAGFIKAELEREFTLETTPNVEILFNEKILKKKLATFKMNGLLVENPESIKAMEKAVAGDYIPVSKKANGDYKVNSMIMDKASFKNLQQFAKDKLIQMAKSLKNGEIQAIPIGKKDGLQCKYCDYWSVCGNYMTNQAIIIKSNDKDKLFDLIKTKDKQEGEKSE